jgi:uncharacterized protein YhdP
LKTDGLTGTIAGAAITVRGELRDGKIPDIHWSLSAPAIDWPTLGIASKPTPPPVKNLQATGTLVNNQWVVQSLTGRVGVSDLRLQGQVVTGKRNVAELALQSDNLRGEDLEPLLALSPGGGKGREWVVAVRCEARTVRFERITAEDLSLKLHWERDKIQLPEFSARVFSGRLTGSLETDLRRPQGPRHNLSFDLQGAYMEQIMAALAPEDRYLLGTLNLGGQLQAAGTAGKDLVNTLTGSLRFRLETGKVRRYGTLSKVFSIINVSSFLSTRLPEPSVEGLPLDYAGGNLILQDGIVSSDDLFLHGNAANLSLVGRLDLPQLQVDYILGVQPLQTVDKVVGLLPVVNWVLLDRDRGLVTVYFRIKGPWKNPGVTPVPVQSLSQSTLGIVSRLFQLPVKLFTDTGEVILGPPRPGGAD